MYKIFFLGALLSAALSCKSVKLPEGSNEPPVRYTEEKHLKNVRQLTFGGDNAEAYWSFDDSKLIFQATNTIWGAECDQIYIFDLNKWEKGKTPPLISTGKGKDHLLLFYARRQISGLCIYP